MWFEYLLSWKLKSNIDKEFCRIHYNKAKAWEISSIKQILAGYSWDVLSSLNRSTNKCIIVFLGKYSVKISYEFLNEPIWHQSF